MQKQKTGRKEAVLEQEVTAAEPDQITTPSLKPTHPHQLNNAYHLVSQLEAFFFFLEGLFPNQLNFVYIWNLRTKVKEKKMSKKEDLVGGSPRFLMKKTKHFQSGRQICAFTKNQTSADLKSVKASPFYTTAVSKLTFPWSCFSCSSNEDL